MVRSEFEKRTENEKQIRKNFENKKRSLEEETVNYFGFSNVFVLFVEEVVVVVVVESVVEKYED